MDCIDIRSDFSRDLYQNRESVYRKYFIILKQRPERIIEYLICTRQTRLKYTIFGSRKKWTTNINGNLPSVRRSSIWTSATTTTELPDRYSRLNTTEVWLHTFYSTVEHAALPTSYELCTIHCFTFTVHSLNPDLIKEHKATTTGISWYCLASGMTNLQLFYFDV